MYGGGIAAPLRTVATPTAQEAIDCTQPSCHAKIKSKGTKFGVFCSLVSIPKINERGNHKWCNL
jgi:hypothetical protein